MGRLAYDYLKDKYDIRYYCDNDDKKVGIIFNGLKVITVDRMAELVKKEGYYVIISSRYYKDIGEQLLSMGIEKDKFKVFYNKLEYLQTIYEIEEKKEAVKNFYFNGETKFNNIIFSKYNLHLVRDSIYIKSFIEAVNKKHMFMLI